MQLHEVRPARVHLYEVRPAKRDFHEVRPAQCWGVRGAEPSGQEIEHFSNDARGVLGAERLGKKLRFFQNLKIEPNEKTFDDNTL